MGLKIVARNRKVKTYSLGMKQRLGIAVALIANPKLLILDEPLNGIDIEGMIEFRDILRRLQNKWITIIISSHILSEIQKACTHIGVIAAGQIKFNDTLEKFLKLGEDVEQSYLNLLTSKTTQ